MYKTCEVLLNTMECEAPPGSEPADVHCRECGSVIAKAESGPGIRTRCYACGQVACKGDSRVRMWPTASGKRRVRVCNDCVGDYQ